MSAWLFQGNEETAFPISEYLEHWYATSGEISWTVGKKRLAIRAGDRAFMWRAEGGRPGTGGLIAVGLTTSEPFQNPNQASALWYDREDPRAADLDVWWVRIRWEDLRLTPAAGMVRRVELRRDPRLRDLCILRMAQRTICAVEPRHELALLARWSAALPARRP